MKSCRPSPDSIRAYLIRAWGENCDPPTAEIARSIVVLAMICALSAAAGFVLAMVVM